MRQRAAANTIERPAATPDAGPIQSLADDAAYKQEVDRLNRLHERLAELRIETQEIVARRDRFPDYNPSTRAEPPDPVAVALGEAAAVRDERPAIQTRLERLESELHALRPPTELQTRRVEQAARRASRRIALARKPARLALLRNVRAAMLSLGESIDKLSADDAELDAAGVSLSAGFGRPMALNAAQLGGLASVDGEGSRLSRLLTDLDSEIGNVEAHEC